SANGGAQFDPIREVASGPDLQYLAPQLAVTGEGALEVTYYQGYSMGPAAVKRAEYLPEHEGATYSDVGDAGLLITTTRPDYRRLGEYMGVAATPGWVYSAFTSNRYNQRSHIAFGRFAAP